LVKIFERFENTSAEVSLCFALLALAYCWYKWVEADHIEKSTDINNPYRKICKNCSYWERIGGKKTGNCKRLKESFTDVYESPEDFGCRYFGPCGYYMYDYDP